MRPLRPLAEGQRDSRLGLTAAEERVLSLIAAGYSNAGIAELLFLSSRTVETHVAHIFMKLGLRDLSGVHRRVLAAVLYLEDAALVPGAVEPPTRAAASSSRPVSASLR